MSDRLDGRVAVITGASQGLGVSIADAYVRAGASVLICARDAALLEQRRQELVALVGAGKQQVLALAADVSREEDVARLTETALQAFPQVHVLVNNAGIYGPHGAIEQVAWREWIQAIEINLLGSVLMCRALMPHMKAQRYGKIIQLSGGGATNPLPFITAYAVSKVAVVRFVESLADEVREFGIDVNSLAPGALNTRLLEQVLASGPEIVGRDFHARAMKQKETGGASLTRAAEACVFLASGASDGITGKLISAVWDPWEKLGQHTEELATTDIYTLRRIVPRDRGMTWGGK